MENFRTLANKMIEANKPLSKVTEILGRAYKAEHRDNFYKTLRAEYDVLYPSTKEEVCLVHVINDTTNVCDACGNTDAVVSVPIEPEISYEEYRDEVIVVTPYQEATYDTDGTLLTEEVAEVTEMVRPYVEPLQADIDALVLADNALVSYQAKIAKETAIESISRLTVNTTSGKVFDADLESRQNMADAILASGSTGVTETTWRLADNTEVLVTLDELKEAHVLALQAYATAKGIS